MLRLGVLVTSILWPCGPAVVVLAILNPRTLIESHTRGAECSLDFSAIQALYRRKRMFKAHCSPSSYLQQLLSFGIVAAFFLCGSPLKGQEVGADENLPRAVDLYRRYLQNNGGRENIQALTTLIMHGQIISNVEQEIEFRLVRKRPNLFRMKSEFQGTSIEVICNGKRGWRIVSRGFEEVNVTELEDEALASALELNSIDGPFFKLAGLYDSMHPVAIEEVMGQPAIRVEIDPSSGCFYHTIWLSLKHYQEVKLAWTTPSKEGQALSEKEVVLSDFEMSDGVYFGKNSDYYVDGMLANTVKIERIRTNVSVFNSYFDRN
jgi:hypothetical protein